jgi:hypothetical protein
MTDFIAFQQFTPVEKRGDGRCIWCGEKKPKNRAHVISRKLVDKADRAVVLRLNVCRECNSKCGRLEEWILRHTPLAWIRLMKYLGSNPKGNTRSVPSYFFAANLQQWVVFHLDAQCRAYAIVPQLIISSSGTPQFLTESPPEIHGDEASRIVRAIESRDFVVDLRAALPEDFAPRVLVEGERTILVARTQQDVEHLISIATALNTASGVMRRAKLQNTGEERQHFKWSCVNWARFCTKAAYESLCLFEAPEVCLAPAYERVREFVREGVSESAREFVFDQKGPISSENTPSPVHVDLTTGQNAPCPIPALLLHCEPSMHAVALYEIDGWVVSTVSFAGFPPNCPSTVRP